MQKTIAWLQVQLVMVFHALGAAFLGQKGMKCPYGDLRLLEDEDTQMLNRRTFNAALGAGAMAHFSGAHASSYPAKPIRMVVPLPAGAAVDTIGRIFAEVIAKELNASVYVENKVGANGTIGSADVAKAPADGYTLLVNSSTLVQAPLIMASAPYHPVKDFTPLLGIGTTPQTFVVHASTPVSTIEEFASYARGKQFSFGTYGPGTTSHAFLQLFANRNGLDMVHVPYKGEGAMSIDLMGNRLECAMGTMTTLGPHIRAGKLKALACLGETRIPSLPNVPTFLERGYPREFAWGGFIAFFAPKGLPAERASQLASVLSKGLQQPNVRKKLADLDMIVQETQLAGTQALVTQCYETWSRIARELKLADNV